MALISWQDQYLNFAITLSNSIRSLEFEKMQKPNHFLKKTLKLTLKSTALFHYSPSYRKLPKELSTTKHKNFLTETKFPPDFNLVFEKNYSTNTCLEHLTDKTTSSPKNFFFPGIVLIDLQKAFDITDH